MNNILRMAALALTLLCAGTPVAQAQQVIPAQSEIAFVSRQMGVPVEGHFRKWTAQVVFDPQKPQAAQLAFSIDAGSITLGVAETDAEVLKPDWFHASKFPKAEFRSTSVKATGSGRYEVKGVLSIKGSQQEVTLPVSLSQTGTGAALQTEARGSFPIKRLAFKIGEGPWADTSMVADEVQVKFKIQLSGIAALK